MEFNQKRERIYDTKGDLIGSGDQTKGNIFYLDMTSETLLMVKFDDVRLWNRILCHVNFDTFVSVSKMKKVRGFPKLSKPENMTCK